MKSRLPHREGMGMGRGGHCHETTPSWHLQSHPHGQRDPGGPSPHPPRKGLTQRRWQDRRKGAVLARGARQGGSGRGGGNAAALQSLSGYS